MRDVYLYLTHGEERVWGREFRRWRARVRPLGSVVLVWHSPKPEPPAWTRQPGIFAFDSGILDSLGYTPFARTLVPGSAHYPMMAFFRQNLDFDRYWLVECDVRLRGSWPKFFKAFDDDPADFLAAHLRTFHQEPGWDKWELVHPSHQIPEALRLRTFNPVCRFSKRALEQLDRDQAGGWKGHNEVLVASLLLRAGLLVRDFNSRRRWYTEGPADPRGRCAQGSFRFRPVLLGPCWVPNRLYHPVKPFSKPLATRTRRALKQGAKALRRAFAAVRRRAVGLIPRPWRQWVKRRVFRQS